MGELNLHKDKGWNPLKVQLCTRLILSSYCPFCLLPQQTWSLVEVPYDFDAATGKPGSYERHGDVWKYGAARAIVAEATLEQLPLLAAIPDEQTYHHTYTDQRTAWHYARVMAQARLQEEA